MHLQRMSFLLLLATSFHAAQLNIVVHARNVAATTPRHQVISENIPDVSILTGLILAESRVPRHTPGLGRRGFAPYTSVYMHRTMNRYNAA
jgi:hypothetical protein